MEEIIKKIIEIDNNAKAIVKDENSKKINIEEAIEEEFNTQKVVIDLEYKDEINKKKNEKAVLFENKKNEIDEKLKLEIDKVQNFYNENSERIVASIVDSIKNEEN